MPDAPPRRRYRAPVLSPTAHVVSPPPRGFPPDIALDRPPVRRNLFSSKTSSRMTSSQPASSQPSPDITSLPPITSPHSHPSSANMRFDDPRRFDGRGSARGRPRRDSYGSTTDSIPSDRDSDVEIRVTRAPPPRFTIPRDRDSALPPSLPAMPSMGRLGIPRPRPTTTGMRRPNVGRQRARRSEEDEIVVRTQLGDYDVTDPLSLIDQQSRLRIQGQLPEGYNEDSDSEGSPEEQAKKAKEAEDKKTLAAVKKWNKESDKILHKEKDQNGKPKEMLRRFPVDEELNAKVKARMKDFMNKLEDDEWMFSPGDHK